MRRMRVWLPSFLVGSAAVILTADPLWRVASVARVGGSGALLAATPRLLHQLSVAVLAVVYLIHDLWAGQRVHLTSAKAESGAYATAASGQRQEQRQDIHVHLPPAPAATVNVTIDSGRMKELVRESIEKPDKVTEVAAERFMLVDKDGKTRGALGVLADGSPFLGFYGAGGQPRVAVGVSGEGSSFIDLYDDAGRPRASLGVASDEAWLSLASSSGKSVARVEVPTRGSAQLTFRDEEKNARAQLVTAEDGCSMLLLSDQKGRLRSVMGVLEGATPLAELYDENGKSQVSLRIGRSNSPHLSSMMRREGIAPRWASRPARDHT